MPNYNEPEFTPRKIRDEDHYKDVRAYYNRWRAIFFKLSGAKVRNEEAILKAHDMVNWLEEQMSDYDACKQNGTHELYSFQEFALWESNKNRIDAR